MWNALVWNWTRAGAAGLVWMSDKIIIINTNNLSSF